jgi:hypothetical protein
MRPLCSLWPCLPSLMIEIRNNGAKYVAVAKQRPGKHLTATTTHATVEELLDALFSVRSMSYQILNM